MTDCKLCGIVQAKVPAKVVYYDEICVAFLKQMPAAPGHMLLVPKKHYTIFEQVPDNEVNHIFKIASKLSTAAFETFGHGGTNIIINNGGSSGQTHPHFSIEIIPRNENDGLNLMWQPKQLSEEEMSTAELILKEETKNLGGFAKPTKEEKKEIKEPKKEVMKEDKNKENYLFKSLIRRP